MQELALLAEAFWPRRIPAFVSRLSGAPQADALRYLAELRTDRELQQLYRDGRARIRRDSPAPVTLPRFFGAGRRSLYALVRAMRPETVVEVGVNFGISTLLILRALQRNGKGALYSNDLVGGYSECPPELTAALVPEAMRRTWTLVPGDARKELPPLLAKLGSVDLFFNDALEEEQPMLWEFSLAWRHVRPGGVLLSDDTDVPGDPMGSFAREVQAEPVFLGVDKYAGVRKPSA